MSKRLFILVILFSFVLSACGGGNAPGAPSSNISVEMSEFKFSPQEMTVFSGKETSFELKNDGAVEHAFTVLKKGVVAKTPFDHDKQAVDILTEFKVGAGNAETFKFTLPEPGEYALICNIPGHMEAGMVGKIIAVQP